MSEQTILPADKAYRTKILVIFIVAMGLAAAAAQWGVPALMERMELAVQNADDAMLLRYIRIVEMVFVAVFLGFIPFCVYNIRMGLLTKTEQQFPNSRMRVLRDTPIITGEATVRRGGLLVVMGAGLAFVTVATAFAAIMTIETIARGAL